MSMLIEAREFVRSIPLIKGTADNKDWIGRTHAYEMISQFEWNSEQPTKICSLKKVASRTSGMQGALGKREIKRASFRKSFIFYFLSFPNQKLVFLNTTFLTTLILVVIRHNTQNFQANWNHNLPNFSPFCRRNLRSYSITKYLLN